jgi:hypothetical protein
VVANQGNLQLTDVEVATNLQSSAWDLVNMANITDGLTVGEAVVLSSNITFNKTMIRAGAANLSTNATARTVTANLSSTSFATINTPWCADNRTARESVVCGSCCNGGWRWQSHSHGKRCAQASSTLTRCLLHLPPPTHTLAQAPATTSTA